MFWDCFGQWCTSWAFGSSGVGWTEPSAEAVGDLVAQPLRLRRPKRVLDVPTIRRKANTSTLKK